MATHPGLVFPAPKAGLHSGAKIGPISGSAGAVFPAPKAGLHSGTLVRVRRTYLDPGLPGPEGRAP